MALLYGAVATPIFSDTGWEHQALYDRIGVVEATLRDFHGEGFAIVKVDRDGQRLQDYIADYKFYPSTMMRFCTRLFKIEPIDRYLRQFADPDDPEKKTVELMIGLNAEEGDRTGNHQLLPHVAYTYPLLEAGITRDKCLEYLERVKLKPSFPPYMARGGCVGCFFKSKKEYQAMAVLSPEEADSVADLEEVIQDRRGKFYSVRDGIPSMRNLIAEARMNLFAGDEEQMYTDQDIHTSCGVFCHR